MKLRKIGDSMASKSRRGKSKSHNKKKLILMYKIITVVVAVVLTVSLGVFIPKSLNNDSSSIEMTKEYEPGYEISSSLKKNEETKELIDFSTPKELIVINKNEIADNEIADNEELEKEIVIESEIIEQNDLGDDDMDETDKELENKGITDELINQDTTNKDTTNKETTNLKEITNNTEDSILEGEIIESLNIEEINTEDLNETGDDQTQYVKDEWVDDMIQDNKEDIDNNDLVKGASIYNKLDTAYLFGLAEGGMTEEENAEAMIYLEANLTSEELVIAKALFDRYIGLAN